MHTNIVDRLIPTDKACLTKAKLNMDSDLERMGQGCIIWRKCQKIKRRLMIMIHLKITLKRTDLGWNVAEILFVK